MCWSRCTRRLFRPIRKRLVSLANSPSCRGKILSPSTTPLSAQVKIPHQYAPLSHLLQGNISKKGLSYRCNLNWDAWDSTVTYLINADCSSISRFRLNIFNNKWFNGKRLCIVINFMNISTDSLKRNECTFINLIEWKMISKQPNNLTSTPTSS